MGAKLAGLHACAQNMLRFRIGSDGVEATAYDGDNPYPNAPAYKREDVTVREASPTAKHGGSKRLTLSPPVDYLVILTKNRQAPRGTFAPSLRRTMGRTAVTGYVDPYVRSEKQKGNVSDDLRYIP